MPTLWRVFPWHPAATSGEPCSADYLPPQSGHGRFDLEPGGEASTWYVAEAPEHAVAERIQNLRNRTLFEEALFERGHRLALVAVELSPGVRLADLCDPDALARRIIPPDHLAYRNREITQRIAADLHKDQRVAGLRWWSVFFGEWHTVALFSDRLPVNALAFGEPEALTLESSAVVAAAAALGIEIE